jgi:hypothetical protein
MAMYEALSHRGVPWGNQTSEGVWAAFWDSVPEEPQMFPMSTVRRAREGRHILLWPDRAEWVGVTGTDTITVINGAWVGKWCADDREWMLADGGLLRDHRKWSCIDDDFIGWANLPPVDGAP